MKEKFDTPKEVVESINKIFEKEIKNNPYYYFAETDLLRRQDKDILFKYLDEKKWYPKIAYDKIRKMIIDSILQKHKDLKSTSYLVYTDSIEVHKITSVESFLKEISKINSKDKKYFRGHENFKWELIPSLYRDEKLVKKEKEMISEMIQKFPNEFSFTRMIDKLTKFQHYGLPTRLIDITENPHVALYFACSEKNIKEDGRIYVFAPTNENIEYADSYRIAILANISRMPSDFGTSNLKDYEEKLISKLKDEKNYFEDYLENDNISTCIFVRGDYNNERIVAQSGAFILCGVKDENKQCAEIPDSLEENNKKHLFIVPRKCKEDILNQLELLNINEATLFPEIDKLSAYIKNSVLQGKK